MAAKRIVTMVASATEIVHGLGEFPFLVGRSHECDYPEEVVHLPCCTRPRFEVSGSSREIDHLVKSTLTNALSIYEVFDDVLERLQPTHIITQTQCEVCAVSLRDVERSVAAKLESRPRVVSLQPNCLADIWDDIRRVACALEIAGRGEECVRQIQAKMEGTSRRAQATDERATVACIEWLEPLMPVGNWMPELIAMAGGSNSSWMTWDELVACDPDVIIAMPCGFDIARTIKELYWLTDNPRWSGLRAVRTGRVYVADGNQYFNRPGPRVAESLAILAEILHPGRFVQAWKGRGWADVQTAVQ